MKSSPLTRREADAMIARGDLPRGGFDVSLASARRCSHGAAQVLLCSPLKRGEPFPTTFWLVCPYLKKKIGSLEAGGIIVDLERALSLDPAGISEHHKEHARLRLFLLGPARRRYLQCRRVGSYRSLRRGGVGGIAYEHGSIHAKCLHLHTASLLALGEHPASEMLRGVLGDLECTDARCKIGGAS